MPGSSSSSSAASAAATLSSHTTAAAAAATGSTSIGAAAPPDDYDASKVATKSSKALKDEERSMVADLDKWDGGVFAAFSTDASLDDSF